MSQANPDLLRFLSALPVLRGVLGVTWFCFALSVITTAARLYTRIYMLRQFGLDDLLVSLAMIMSLASMPMVHVLHRENDGSLRMMILEGSDPGTLIRLLVKLVLPLKLQYIMTIMYPVALGLVKISIVAFYNLFMPRKPYRFYLFACGAALAMLAFSLALAATFQCTPIRDAWDPLNARCEGTNAPLQGVIVNVLNLVSDLILLLLPVPVVLRLRTDMRKKVALMLLFSMGAVGTAVTALRLWKMVVLYQLYGSQSNSPRWFIEITHVVLLSQIEVSIIVVCANMPGLAAWLKRSMGSRTAVGPGGSGSGSGSGSRTLTCNLGCGLTSSCSGGGGSKGSGSNNRAVAGGGIVGDDGDVGTASRHRRLQRGVFRLFRWFGGRRRAADAGGIIGAGNSGQDGDGGGGGGGARGGSYSYRLKALRAPERSFSRSAQDTATACDSESVENFVVVARDETKARRAASEETTAGAVRAAQAPQPPSAHSSQQAPQQQQQQQQQQHQRRSPRPQQQRGFVPLPDSEPQRQRSTLLPPPQQTRVEDEAAQRGRPQLPGRRQLPTGAVVHVTTTIELDANVDEISEEDYEQAGPATVREA